ncbi:MAG: hypothetical protein WBG54_01980 [Acidobacteriaceae bacterium]
MANQAKSRVASAAANGKHGHTLISDGKFRQLYELTLRLRTEAAGGEAVLAAVAADLRADDRVVRESGVAAESLLSGANADGLQGAGTVTFAEQVKETLQQAQDDCAQKNGRVSVILCEGTSHAALLREAWTKASRGKLPVIFVEGLGGEATPGRKRKGSEPDENALPAIPVDAQDVVGLYRVAHESIARARAGSGPTRMLCVNWPATLGATDDAVEHLEHWLEARGLPAQQWRREIDANRQGATAQTAKNLTIVSAGLKPRPSQATNSTEGL